MIFVSIFFEKNLTFYVLPCVISCNFSNLILSTSDTKKDEVDFIEFLSSFFLSWMMVIKDESC